jgi:hypothetical protein
MGNPSWATAVFLRLIQVATKYIRLTVNTARAVLGVRTGKMASTYEVAVNIVSDTRQGVFL